ncbi:MAG: hypothetical protein E7036_09660 [Opitutales bacterium]|nr:hypothetical protein [Opitutales bacterium]
MKKIIITTIALVLGVGAMAKNLEQLTSEWNQLTDRKSRIDYVQQNSTEIKAVYQDWFKNGHKSKSYGIFSATYWHTSIFDDVSEYEAIFLSANKAYRVYSANNPNWYDDIKANGFVVNGKKLTAWQIFTLAEVAKDYDVVEQTIVNNPIGIFINTGFKTSTGVLLRMNNAELAKQKLIEMQTIIAIRNPNDARLDTLKTYLRIVREKCIDAKLK